MILRISGISYNISTIYLNTILYIGHIYYILPPGRYKSRITVNDKNYGIFIIYDVNGSRTNDLCERSFSQA